jgi:vacuolar protein sorting-associated protein 54
VPAYVDDNVYRVPWSVLLLIEQVVNILDISESYSDMNLDIISKIVVLCELYDQKTDKLVLGAEAMQSAGLKSITAKHLAVAAQSYDLLLKLLPHVRAFNKLPAGPRSGAMTSHSAKDVSSKYRYDNLDTIMNSITTHHSAILSKFVRIVEDMMDSIAQRCLKPHDWDKMAINGHSSNQHVDYFEEIQKNINSLYKTLVAVLPIAQVVEVFSRIFHVLKVKILQHFDISVSTNGASKPASFVKQPNTMTGKQRVLDEISYFSNVLSRLKHLDTSCLTDLEEVFKSRYNINSK